MVFGSDRLVDSERPGVIVVLAEVENTVEIEFDLFSFLERL